jgi:hypothetical protein
VSLRMQCPTSGAGRDPERLVRPIDRAGALPSRPVLFGDLVEKLLG